MKKCKHQKVYEKTILRILMVITFLTIIMGLMIEELGVAFFGTGLIFLEATIFNLIREKEKNVNN